MSRRHPQLFATPKMQGAFMPHVMLAVCGLARHSLTCERPGMRRGVSREDVLGWLAARGRHEHGLHCSALKVKNALHLLAFRHELIEIVDNTDGRRYRVTKRGWRWLDEWGAHYEQDETTDCTAAASTDDAP